MNEQLINSKIQQISSEKLKQELLFFLDFLLVKQFNEQEQQVVRKAPKFGCAKGTFKMADDFDEPLEDFKGYME